MKKEYGQNSFELKGKKLGIIGAGNIGKEVAKIGIGIGMEILIHDYKGRDVEIELSSIYHQDIKILLSSQSLSNVLCNSDIITIHTPGTNEVIGNKEIQQMKNGCCLINCARGGVVNEIALIEAISNGKIKHVGLDVFEEEPPKQGTSSYDLIKNPIVSISPHTGAATKEAQTRVSIELANGIVNFFEN
jgi:D-3-phosphoglycerate dehydrogenase